MGEAPDETSLPAFDGEWAMLIRGMIPARVEQCPSGVTQPLCFLFEPQNTEHPCRYRRSTTHHEVALIR